METNMEHNSVDDLDSSERDEDENMSSGDEWVEESSRTGKSRDSAKNRKAEKSLLAKKKRSSTNRPFQCQDCDGRFLTVKALEKHMATCRGKKPYKCEHCGDRFTASRSLMEHIKRHTGEKPYRCDICGKRFIQSNTLTEHRRIHTGEKPYACNVCGKKYAQKYPLTCHMRRHTGEKPYVCSHCDKGFVAGSFLNIHIRDVHLGEKPFKCDECGDRQRSKAELTHHVLTHHSERSKFECGVCLKMFATSVTLKKHVKNVHAFENEKPHTCNDCGNKYASASAYRTHVRLVHSDKAKKYQCSTCETWFRLKREFLTHRKACLTAEGKPDAFVCRICGKDFTTEAACQEHRVADHESQTVHQCDKCEKKFPSLIALRSHIRTAHGPEMRCRLCRKRVVIVVMWQHFKGRKDHKNASLFCCTRCKEEFKKYSLFLNHCRKCFASRGEQFMCQYCGEGFQSSADHKQHELVHLRQ